MVCSCVVPSKRVLLQIILCSCIIGTTFWREKWQIASLSCQEAIKIWKQTWWSNDKTIIELGYHKISWFVRVSQINIELLATDKSGYFAQPCPIIVNYYMASSVSGQDEPNGTMWLATRSGLPAVSRKKNIPESHIINSLWTLTLSRSINTQKENLANIQPSWPNKLGQ